MTLVDFSEFVLQRAAIAGIRVSPEVIEPCWYYITLLAKWNQRMNLTALNLEPVSPAALDRLILEPLAAADLASGSARMLDIGSGSGSPAIPLALSVRPRHVVLVESRHKKASFLREALRSLEIPGEVVAGRFEDHFSSPTRAGAFDLVTLRAVRLDPPLLESVARVTSPPGIVMLFGNQETLPRQMGSLTLASSRRLPPKDAPGRVFVLRGKGGVSRGTPG